MLTKYISIFLRRSIRRPVLALALLVLLVSTARYYQRYENNLLRHQFFSDSLGSLFTTDNNVAFLDVLFEFQPASIVKAQSFNNLPAPVRAQLLGFYSFMGWYGQEGRLMSSFLNSNEMEDDTAEILVHHLTTSVYQDATNFLANGQYELARFRAQRFINFTYSLPNAALMSAYDREKLNNSWKIVKLTKGRYLEKNQQVVMQIISDTINGWSVPAQMNSNKKDTPIDKSLEDEVAYSTAAKEASSRHNGEKQDLWKQFIQAFPSSPKIEEAYFNIINDVMQAYTTVPTDTSRLSKLMAINRTSLMLCDSFLEQFPKSYLADDAIRYIMRIGFSIGDGDLVYTSYRRLARDYKQSDSFQRTQTSLRQWFSSGYGLDPADARLGVRLLATGALQPPSVSLGSVASLLGPEGERVIAKIGGILGETNIAATSGIPIGPLTKRLLIQWLSAKQAEEGVATLWHEGSVKN